MRKSLMPSGSVTNALQIPKCAVRGCDNHASVMCPCVWGTLCTKSRLCINCDTHQHTFVNPSCCRFSLYGGDIRVISLPPNMFLSSGMHSNFPTCPTHIESRAVPAHFISPNICGVLGCNGDSFTPSEWKIESSNTVMVLKSTNPYFVGAVTEFKCDICSEPHCVSNKASFTDQLGSRTVFPMSHDRVRAHIMDAGSLDIAASYHNNGTTGVPSQTVAAVLNSHNVDAVRLTNYGSHNVEVFENLLKGKLHSNCIQCSKGGIDTAADGNMKMCLFEQTRVENSIQTALPGPMVQESVLRKLKDEWKKAATVVKNKAGAVLWDSKSVTTCISGSGGIWLCKRHVR